MRKCWYPTFFPFFTMFSTPLRDQSHSLIHILFVLCRRFRLMSLKLYCLVIDISHKTLEIGCAWSKGSGERLQGRHGPLVRFSHSIHYQAPEQSCVGTRMQCSCSALNFHPPSCTIPHDDIFDTLEKASCENHGKIRQCIFFTNNVFIPFMTEILSNLKYCNLVTG